MSTMFFSMAMMAMRNGNGMIETPWALWDAESAAGVIAVHAIPAGRTTGRSKPAVCWAFEI